VGFEHDTALRPDGAGVFHGTLAEGWETPRGPLGGYVMALVMRGFELAVDDPERQARSVTMHFLRVPAPGPVTVQVQVERAGRSLSSVSARLEQDNKLLGIALGAYSTHSLLLGRFRSRLVRDGFFDEDGELWSPDGTLVAQSRQLGLLIGAEA
jgi:acyl-CoA thioesterase